MNSSGLGWGFSLPHCVPFCHFPDLKRGNSVWITAGAAAAATYAGWITYWVD